jgi:hypothetical protein
MARTAIVTAALTCLFFVQEQGALAEPIGEVDNPNLVDLLNFMEVIAERGGKTEPDLPLFIRLVRLRGSGECDATPLSCPMERVYIAVSGEYPERKLYQLPGAPGWDFKEWISTPDGESADDYYTLILEKKVVAADISKGWWTTERYKISINIHSAKLERLP